MDLPLEGGCLGLCPHLFFLRSTAPANQQMSFLVVRRNLFEDVHPKGMTFNSAESADDADDVRRFCQPEVASRFLAWPWSETIGINPVDQRHDLFLRQAQFDQMPSQTV